MHLTASDNKWRDKKPENMHMNLSKKTNFEPPENKEKINHGTHGSQRT